MLRLRYIKYLLVSGFLILTFLIQLVFIQDWNFVLILQTLILDFAIILGIYAFRGFDNSTITSLNASFVAFFSGTLLGSLFALLVILFFRPRISHPVFLIAVILAVLPFPVLSNLILKRALKTLPPKKYLVVGKESEIGEILREVERASMGKVQVIGYMNPSPMALEQAITTNIFDTILVADQKLSRSVESILEKADSQGKSVEFLPLIVEQTLKRIPIELIEKFKDYYEIVFSSVKISRTIRIFDILFSIIILTILSPVVLISIAMILIRDGRPIFYTQLRHGLNGKLFKVYKFRTMDDAVLPDGTLGEPKMTKSGRFLRKTRLNEIPQIINVLRGEMSLVGPRPDIPPNYQFCIKEIPFYNFRTKVLPGITGHAQVSYKYLDKLEYETYAKRFSFDLYYIKNMNLALYLTILLRTIETMILRRGE